MVAGGVYTAVSFVQRSEVLITERCTAAGAGSDDLATDQAANAGLITAVAVRRGLPARAPYHATNAFYDALVKVPGYEGLDITVAAQRVQRSAYPDAYAQHEVMGRAFASALAGHTPAGLDCSLRAPDTAGDPAAVKERLTAAFGGVAATTEGSTLVLDAEGEMAWALAHWAVANAKGLSITEVQAEGRGWTREDRNGWQPSGVPAGQVRITVAGSDE
jgi:hypothetical protein